MANQLRDVRADFVSFVDRAATRDPQRKSEPRRFLLFKRDGTPDPTDLASPPEKGATAMGEAPTAEELQAELTKTEKERDEAKKALAKAEVEHKEALEKAAKSKSKAADGEDEPDEDDVAKAELTPAARALLEKAEKSNANLSERVQKAEDIAKAERDQRVTREWIAKAEKEMPDLPGDPAETGPLMKALSEAAPEAFQKFEETVLKAASEQIKTGDLLAEKGRSGQPSRSSTDGLASAQRKAEEIRKADSSLSASEAFARAMKDPDIEKAYLAEQRG
jgi:hypothetical protein